MKRLACVMILMIMLIIPTNADAEVKQVMGKKLYPSSPFMKLTSDYGFVTRTPGDYNEAIITKYDREGNQIWQHQSECDHSYYNETLRATNNGQIITLGDNACIESYDLEGKKLWSNTETVNSSRLRNWVQTTSDGGFVFAERDQFLKFNFDGNLSWKKGYADEFVRNYEDRIIAISYEFMSTNMDIYDLNGELEKTINLERVKLLTEELTNNEIIFKSFNDADADDSIVISYDLNGNKLWEKQLDFNADSAIITNDGYLIFGHSDNLFFIRKYDKLINLIWEQTYQNQFEYFDRIENDYETLDGGYLVLIRGFNCIYSNNSCMEIEYGHLIIKYLETHRINLGGTKNGTIISNLEEAYYGDEVTITMTPDKGYEVGNIKVTDANGNEIEVVDGKFIMPGSKVTVNVEFAYPEVIPNPQTAVAAIIALMVIIIGMFATIYIMINKEQKLAK